MELLRKNGLFVPRPHLMKILEMIYCMSWDKIEFCHSQKEGLLSKITVQTEPELHEISAV